MSNLEDLNMPDTDKTKKHPKDTLRSGLSAKNIQSAPTGASNRLTTKVAPTQQSTSSQVSSNQVVGTQLDDRSGIISDGVIASVTDPSPQLRSTLAIGQLIASNRPTAGSRLIAGELRNLTNSIHEESASIRAEIASLSSNLSNSLKSVMEEDREQRGLTAGNVFGRRPMFGHFATRRFPVFRRRQATRLNAGTNTTSHNSPSPVPSPGPPNLATKSSVQPNRPNTLKQASAKSAGIATAKKTFTVFKNPWLADEAAYDDDSDTDSSDTIPSSTP